MPSMHPLISTERVQGTDVFDADGNKLGTVHSLMIGKQDGLVAYAVLSFGGWMGFGGELFPVPWSRLTYSTTFDGYVVTVRETELHAAPKFQGDADHRWNDGDWRDQIDRYYSALN